MSADAFRDPIEVRQHMKPATARIRTAWRGRCLAALLFFTCLSGFLSPALAQERWLLIFDTSSLMKKRLPAVSNELVNLFITNMGDRLHAGDSVGVWTFNDRLHRGEYPLMAWQPDKALAAATNIFAYVQKQDFKGKTTFGLLQPLLHTVVEHSERLTVVIFCDGDGQILGTPYDDGISANMLAGMAERKKHREPVVLVLRTQMGLFVGADVNYPPSEVAMPKFPPLPPPPSLAPTNPPPPPPAPVINLPPLILVGKPHPPVTNVAPAAPVVTNPETTMPAVPVSQVATPAAEVVTNQATEPVPAPPGRGTMNVAPPSRLPPPQPQGEPAPLPAPPARMTTNEAVIPPPAPAPVPVPAALPTNAVSNPIATNAMTEATTPGTDRSTVILLAVGGGLLVAAVVLVLVLLFLRRPPKSSLISKVMSEDPRSRK